MTFARLPRFSVDFSEAKRLRLAASDGMPPKQDSNHARS
jgi:hypothetical protein